MRVWGLFYLPISRVFRAINGTVTVTFSSAPTVTPVAADFVVTQAIGTAAATTVTPTAVVATATGATLTVPTIVGNATADQSIVYSVAYKGATAVAAPAFTVAKVTALGVSTVSAVNGTVTVTMNSVPTVAPAIADFAVTNAGTAVAPTSIATTGAVVTLTVPLVLATAADQSVVYSVSYKTATAVAASAFTVPATPALAITSASATNISELKVSFNNNLNLTAAQTVANYVVKDNNGATVQVDNAQLADNQKDVTLTIGTGAVPAALNTLKTYTVTVAKDLTLVTPTALTTSLVSAAAAVADTTVPTISAVTPVGNLGAIVTFNKPILLNGTAINTFAEKTAAGAYVAGQDYSTAAITSATYVANTGYKQVKLVFAAKPAGNYDLRVFGGAADIRDAGGTNMVTSTRTYAVAEASSVAQATVLTVNNRTQVDVTFDSAVQLPAAGSLLWGAVGTANAVTALSPTKLRYTFTTNIVPTGSQTFTVSPTGTKVVDGYGNNVPAKTFTTTVASDSTTTATISVVDDDTIDVVFSKQMKSATNVNSTTANEASNKDNYVLKNSAGTIVDISAATSTYSEVGTVYKTRLTKTNWNLTPGSYTLSVSNVKDVYGDVMTAIANQAITVADTTGPSVAGAGVAGVVASRTISITFPEAMATSGDKSIASASNYLYAADGATFTALKTGASLVAAADGKSVVITLAPEETAIVLATSKIQIGRSAASTIYVVGDVAGNIQAELPGVGTQITVVADAAPRMNAGVATVKNATTINVALAGGTKVGVVVASDFKYTIDAITWKPVSNAQLVVNATTGAHSIDFTISDTLTAMVDRTKVQVKVDSYWACSSKHNLPCNTKCKLA